MFLVSVCGGEGGGGGGGGGGGRESYREHFLPFLLRFVGEKSKQSYHNVLWRSASEFLTLREAPDPECGRDCPLSVDADFLISVSTADQCEASKVSPSQPSPAGHADTVTATDSLPTARDSVHHTVEPQAERLRG